MNPLPLIGRRGVLRALAASTAVAGTALLWPDSGASAAPAQSPAAATPPAPALAPPGHQHLIGVL